MPPSALRSHIIGFALVCAIAAALVFSDALRHADRAILGGQFSLLRSFLPRDVEKDVVIVGIDERTIAKLPQPMTLWHPHFARFLQATVTGGAAAVGLDVVLPDRSYDAIVPGHDRRLLAALLAARGAAPLVVARTIDREGRPRVVHPVLLSAAGPNAEAFALLPLDGDGVVRRFDERLTPEGQPVATLAGAMAERLGAPRDTGLIDFSRGSRFEYLPLHHVLAWHAAGDISSLRGAFSGKPVLLGSVLKVEDRLAAPVNLSADDPNNVTMPAVMLHAQALRNLLNGHLIASVPAWLILIACLTLACVWWSATTLPRALVAIGAGAIVIAAASTALLATGWYAPPSAAFATLFLAAAGRSARDAAARR